MKLTLIGHDDLYAVEQLQMALFSADGPGEAVSKLSRSNQWITASTTITRDGKTARGIRRMRTGEETVQLRRRILQQSYYAAAIQLLPVLQAPRPSYRLSVELSLLRTPDFELHHIFSS